jgi:hypothetical protein
MKTAMFVFLIGCGSTAATVAPRERVPDAVDASARKLAGAAPIDRIEREHDAYEVTWHVNGLEREAEIRADGTVVRVEEEVAVAEVPAVVRDSARAKLGAAAVKFVRLQDGRWEAETLVDGHEREVVIAPDGKVLGDEADDDDDDDDDEGHDD